MKEKWFILRTMYNIDIAEIIFKNSYDTCQVCHKKTPNFINKTGKFCSFLCYEFV